MIGILFSSTRHPSINSVSGPWECFLRNGKFLVESAVPFPKAAFHESETGARPMDWIPMGRAFGGAA